MDSERLALFQELLKKKGLHVSPSNIKRRSAKGASPLSFAQQRLWFIHQLDQGWSLYHKPCGLRLRGILDITVLTRSIHEIIRRHEILRTVFVVHDGQPMQVVVEKQAIPIELVDLRQFPASERDTELQRRALIEALRPFDLARGPLVRVTVFRLQEEEYVLLLTMHHIVFDDWSVGVFMQELVSLYQAYLASKTSPLPELPVQYADFAAWQRYWLQGEVLERQIHFWKEYLRDAPQVLDLPTDYPRPDRQDYEGEYLPIYIQPEVTEKLRALSQQCETTLFVVLLAAFQTLLYRYSNQEEMVIGTPIANRNRVETEGLIGCFINTLALRTNFSGHPTFRELVRRVRKTTLDAYSHQDVPFEKLVEELHLTRNLSRSPLFQVMFVLHNVPLAVPTLPGLAITPFEVTGGAVHFDLALSFEETNQGLSGALGYRSSLFARATVEHMITHFQTLLEAIVAQPDQSIAALPLFSQPGSHILTAKDCSQPLARTEMCLHTLFEEQVRKAPDAPALFCGNECLSYQELNRRSNQMAHYLLSLGVGQESHIGLCLDRSVEMIVGLLGILKAGGAYIPLEPSYPWERICTLLQDAQAKVLLAKKPLLAHDSMPSVDIAWVDDWSALQSFPETNPERVVYPENLAYVIYTSGSTGLAKGVGVEHRQIVQYVRNVTTTLELAAGQHFALASTFAADLGNTVLFPSLCNGKCLHVLSQEQSSDPNQFAAYCDEHAIDILKITPTHLLMLLTARQPEKVLPGRHLILGGETAQWPWIESILTLSKTPLILTNHYGPTETTVGAVTYTVESAHVERQTTLVPIGRPLPHVQTYVLNDAGQQVPTGGVGELYIGGAGVARGYLGLPDKTAERFLPHPFSQEPGARLYRTGDRVRLRADGMLEFLGRMDDQIKLRGFRIEPGEIETTLCQHPAVCEAVVTMQELETGERRLVAYVVTHQNQTITMAELRRYLRQWLPEYMVPAVFTRLQVLPRTANGKVDRLALSPRQDIEAEDQTVISPRDQLEFQLVRMWEEVLDMRPIGVTDNFFELGGHSLAAVRLMQQIQRTFACDLPLSALFQHSTIEQLAILLRQRQSDRSVHSCLIRMSAPCPGNRAEKPLFFIHPIGGNVFCYRELTRRLEAERPMYALQAQGLDGQQVSYRSVEEMAHHYLQLIRDIQPEGPYHLCGWSFGGVVAFEMAQQLRAEGQHVALLALIDSTAPTGNSGTEPSQAALLGAFAADLGLRWTNMVTDLPIAAGRDREEAPLSWLLEAAKRARVIPPDVELEYVRRLWHVYQHNRQALSRYCPQPYDGTVLLFSAFDPLEEVAAAMKEKDDRGNEEIGGNAGHDGDKGWNIWVEQRVIMHSLAGDHYALLQGPNVDAIADVLKNMLRDDSLALKEGRDRR